MRIFLTAFLLIAVTTAGNTRELGYRAKETCTVSVPNGPIVTRSVVQVQGNKARRSVQGAKGFSPTVIYDQEAGKSFLLITESKLVQEMSLGEEREDWKFLIRPAQGKLIGQEKVGQELCDKRQVGKRLLWVSRDRGILLRSKRPNDAGFPMTFEYAEVETGPQPPEAFKVPAGFKTIKPKSSGSLKRSSK